MRPLSDIKAAVVQERGDLLRQRAGRLASAMADHYARRLERIARRGEQTLLIQGRPGPALCREAHRGYDYLVLGHRGLGRVAGTLLGSTVQHALHASPIPVVVVRKA